MSDAHIQILNKHNPANNLFVVYWMQASQRIHTNPAFEYAKKIANKRKKPLVVYFGITDQFPEANLRHFTFMLQGLKEVQTELKQMGIPMVVRLESPQKGIVSLAQQADLVIADRGYLRVQKSWRNNVAEALQCPLIQVEGDVVVPVEMAMQKEAYSAAVIRPKIHKLLDMFLVPWTDTEYHQTDFLPDFESVTLSDIQLILSRLDMDKTVEPVSQFVGGYSQALIHLHRFIESRLDGYEELHNHPDLAYQSELSHYLHFGQISPLEIALQVQKAGSTGSKAFLEQLIVRRELAMNFVHFNANYDKFNCLPDWAVKTLKNHQADIRPVLYSLEELETAQTHDVYWNAAQNEMVHTGKMHGYMRMYWGKKMLEWTQNPMDAFKYALYLNNKYSLDGRDPNGFAGVAWCFGKHDRPWSERAIFGTVRYMNANGLKRKFDMEAYLKKVDAILIHSRFLQTEILGNK